MNRIAGAPPMGATMTIQQQMQQQAQQPYTGGDYAERLVRVEKDVAGLKESMTFLASSVEKGFRDLTGDLKARSTLNWQPISLLAMVLIAFAGWGWALFGSYQARTDAAIAEQKSIAQNFVPRTDLNDRFAVITSRRDDLQRLTDARIERVERDVESVQKQLVPRGEHSEVWAGQRGKDDNIQRQIDGLRKELSDLNTPRDTIQAMQRRIDELERLRRPPG